MNNSAVFDNIKAVSKSIPMNIKGKSLGIYFNRK